MIASSFGTSLDLLYDLIQEPAFEKKVKETRDLDIKYLIPNVFNLSLTSDEIYWKDSKLKLKFLKSLIKPISTIKSNKYKIVGLLVFTTAFIYFTYDYLTNKDDSLQHVVVRTKPKAPVPVAVTPENLIIACLAPNDKYFKDLGNWVFTNMTCNSLNAKLTFNSYTDTTLESFMDLTGNKSSTLVGKVGTLTQTLSLPAAPIIKMDRALIISNLQQAAINYKFKLAMTNLNKFNVLAKFTINSTLSPVFLLNHGVLNNVKLNEISMSFDQNSGFYNWTLQGEI